MKSFTRYSTLHEMLYSVSEKFGNKPAFILKDNLDYSFSVSYFNLLKDVESIGTSLIKLGFSNKKIAIVGRNSYKWAVSYLAASCVGTVISIDSNLPCEDIIGLLNFSDTSIIFGDQENLVDIFNLDKSLKRPVTFVNFDSKTNTDFYYGFDALKSSGLYNLDNRNTFKELRIDSDDIHFGFFSLDDFGNYNELYFSHKDICSNIFSIENCLKFNKYTSVLSILPMSFLCGCIIDFLIVISYGGTISFNSNLNKIFDNLMEYKPTAFLADAETLSQFNDKISKGLKSVLSDKYSSDKHIMDCIPFLMKPFIRFKLKKGLGGRLHSIFIISDNVDSDLVFSLNKFGFTVFPFKNSYFMSEEFKNIDIKNFLHVYEEPVMQADEPIEEIKIVENNEVTALILSDLDKKKFKLPTKEDVLIFIHSIIGFISSKILSLKRLKDLIIKNGKKNQLSNEKKN